jgi:hypothetical protein
MDCGCCIVGDVRLSCPRCLMSDEEIADERALRVGRAALRHFQDAATWRRVAIVLRMESLHEAAALHDAIADAIEEES